MSHSIKPDTLPAAPQLPLSMILCLLNLTISNSQSSIICNSAAPHAYCKQTPVSSSQVGGNIKPFCMYINAFEGNCCRLDGYLVSSPPMETIFGLKTASQSLQAGSATASTLFCSDLQKSIFYICPKLWHTYVTKLF